MISQLKPKGRRGKRFSSIRNYPTELTDIADHTHSTKQALAQITQLQKTLLSQGAHKPENEVRRLSRSRCDTHRTLSAATQPTPQTAPRKSQRGSSDLQVEGADAGSSGSQGGDSGQPVVVQSPATNRNELWKQPPARPRGQRTAAALPHPTPRLPRNTNILAEASISGGRLDVSNGPTLSSQPFTEGQPPSLVPQYHLYKRKASPPPSTHSLEQVRCRSGRHCVPCLHPRVPTILTAQSRTADRLHPPPPARCLSTMNSTPCPAAAPCRTPSRGAPQGATAASHLPLEVPHAQPRRATNTHTKMPPGTVMPPRPGALLQPARTRQPPGLMAIADPRSWKPQLRNVPFNHPAFEVFLTENRSLPCDRLFLALKSPCLYGELVN